MNAICPAGTAVPRAAITTLFSQPDAAGAGALVDVDHLPYRARAAR
ncbi:hypothetical protein P4114_16100 [Pseudomonas aeruginosa]|nr:hypothetical protein [Pseudomonas aeruginosa]